ncbi:MAG: hypothetical protein HY650_08915 [Acidobacteria bacterium]|nr:hypothetical protein [Acidobacteriota bacterium]
MRNTAERVGCLSHLHKLREDIHWFAKDLRNERQYLRPGEAPEEVERRIALIVNLIGYLGSTVDRIEESMTRFRAGCAQEALKRLKEKSADLEAHIQQMNRIL